MKLKIIIIVLFIIASCEKEEKFIEVTSNINEITSKQHQFNEEIQVQFTVENETIDSFAIYLNNKRFTQKNIKLDSLNTQYGANSLHLTLYYNGIKEYNYGNSFMILPKQAPKKITYTLLETYPHNTALFTEGLFYENGTVYESSGLYKKSFLTQYKLGSVDLEHKTKQEDFYFSEGIAKFQNKIFQLTWKEKTVLTYDFKTLAFTKKYDLPSEIIEGWGATSNQNNLIVSNGTSSIYFLTLVNDQLQIQRKINVVDNKITYNQINELEYVDGKIYANVWQKNIILQINPNTGKVDGILDLSALSQNKSTDDVLNGIATINDNTLLVTGKNWNEIYKIKINH